MHIAVAVSILAYVDIIHTAICCQGGLQTSDCLHSLPFSHKHARARALARMHRNSEDTDAKPNAALCNGHVRVCSVSHHHTISVWWTQIVYLAHCYTFRPSLVIAIQFIYLKWNLENFVQDSFSASWLLSVGKIRYGSNVMWCDVMSVWSWGCTFHPILVHLDCVWDKMYMEMGRWYFVIKV